MCRAAPGERNAQGTGQAREGQPPEMQGNGGQASQSQPEAAAGTQPEAAAGAQPEAAAGAQPEGQDLEGEVKQTEASRAEPVQVPSDAVVHIVKDGETLYGICLEYYHSVNNLPVICQWNQLNDENHLSVGQELYLPPAQ